MTEPIAVLWLYYALSWSWFGIPMTPGWVSIDVFRGARAFAVCEQAADVHGAFPFASRKVKAALCLPPDVYLKPISMIERMAP